MTPYYQDGTSTIYHGDWRDVLPGLAGLGAVITDPPWGMDWNTDSTRFSGGDAGGERARGMGRSDWGPIREDFAPFDPAPFLEFPHVVLWGSNHFAQRLPVGTTLVWVKKEEHLHGSFLSDGEVAWMKGGHGVYVFCKPWSPPARAADVGRCASKPTSVHPSQKPVALMRWCFHRAKIPMEATILDPFMGSGPVLQAAKEDGRRAIGIEIEERYCEVAVRRLQQGALDL